MSADDHSTEPAVSSDDYTGPEQKGDQTDPGFEKEETDVDYDAETQWDGNRCPTCAVPIRHKDATEYVCENCDLVLEDSPLSYQRRRVCNATDWRNKRQTGSRDTARRIDGGLGTGVGWGSRDANGNVLSSSQRNRVRTGHWGKHVDAGNLGYALGELERVASTIGVSAPEREVAAQLYRRASEEGLVRGRTIEGFVSACLLVAVRDSSTPMPLTTGDLLAVSRVDDRSKIDNARTALVRAFNDVKLEPAGPEDFVVRIANDASVSNDVLRHARKLLETYEREVGKYSGANPVVTAAVSLHAAFDLLEVENRPTLAVLGRAADVNPTTISKRKAPFLDAVR